VKSAVSCKLRKPSTCKITSPQYGPESRRNEGNENALIAEAEILARSLTVVVSVGYLGLLYLIPKHDIELFRPISMNSIVATASHVHLTYVLL